MIGLETETAVDLTTLARVKTWMGDPEDDTALTNLIVTISRDAMLDILKRPILKSERSEYFDITRTGQKEFCVKGTPIDTTTAPIVIRNTDTPRIWSNSDDVIDADHIICDADRAAQGIVYVDYPLNAGVNALKITYTGGMAEDTDEIISTYPDIALKIDMQVAYLWRRRGNLGIKSEAIVGASVTWYNGNPWLAETAATLEKYARGL